MKKIAIIPARGGSKRIPRKNIKEFLGKPIIAYSIEAALQSNVFDEVMVSTDDHEIAEVAKHFGAAVPFFRSPEASNDFASTSQVLLEVLSDYNKNRQQFEYCCCMYPTAPLTKREKLKQGLDLLVTRGFHSVFPVVKFSYPMWRSLRIEDGKLQMIWPEHINTRSQDLPDTFHDAGQFYWLHVKSFFDHPVLFSDNTGAIELDELEVQDIDRDVDWKLAELKYQLLQAQISNE